MSFFIPLIRLRLGIIAALFRLNAFWDDAREKVAAWLRARGLQKSALMNAVIKLDLFIGSVRSRIFVTSRKAGVVKIYETTFTINEIDDPDIRAELRKRGYANRNILSLVH